MHHGASEEREGRVRALMMAYHFPPLGGAGVQRTVKFVRHLPALGVEPIVLTGPRTHDSTWPPLDSSLEHEVPAGIRVYRLGGELGRLEPKGATSPTLRTIQRFTRRLSPFGRRWIEGCLEFGTKAVAECEPAVLYASMSPFETATAASELSRRTGVPWIADLRDPWALDEMMVYPTRWHRTLELRRMRRDLATAATVIMNTPEASRALVESFPEFKGRVVTITNGYDEEDFARAPENSPHDAFRIVHTGGLHAGLGMQHLRRKGMRRVLGGARTEVNILARSHYYLSKALRQWKSVDPTGARGVELVFSGSVQAIDRRIVEECGVADLVEFTGYVDHSTSVALLQSADLLFLPLHDVPGGDRTRIVPGKLYEYLGSRKPILAAVPAGDARDFVEASGLGMICSPTDVDGMCRLLANRHKILSTLNPASDSFFHRFERRSLAAQLADTIRRSAAAPHPAPASL